MEKEKLSTVGFSPGPTTVADPQIIPQIWPRPFPQHFQMFSPLSVSSPDADTLLKPQTNCEGLQATRPNR
jgi:hypothetical protein